MSFNSDSKSKRSSKSISSNPSSSSNYSSDGRNSNKKKKTAQKPQGMAWGSNSRSSSRSAFRNSPFSDFGSYMVVKNQKLHEQFDAAASSSSHSGSSSGNSIFCGVSIFVDGYTVPSSQELRGYMLKHGGRFENYFSRHHVTHIICSNLPDSKIKNLRAFSGGLPVVKPAWVLDSVAANKLLSWIPYQLDQLATENDNQPKLSTFFTPKIGVASEIANPIVGGQVHSENNDQSMVKVDSSLSEDYASLDQADRCSVEFNDPLQRNIDKVMFEEAACCVESSCESKGIELRDSLSSDGKDPDLKQSYDTCQSSVSLGNNTLDNHNPSEASSSRISCPPKKHHSTLADPNFVENYFKSSRLHFIGTWRNRYRKRFPSSSNGFGYKSSSVSSAAVNEKTAIIHIDMDSFFVSVVIRNRTELLDKPVAVCHSDNPRGTAEISSANYPARDHGVKAGMFVKDAKILCPQLVIVPYDFEAYEKVADQFYDILHKHCNKVQAVSCDEAFLDVSESEVGDPQLLASIIRKEILDTTGCTASAGIAVNMLMARLATKTAKPDGQCYIPPEKIDDYLCALPVKALPGIGHVLEAKLKKRQIKTCGQLRLISKETLEGWIYSYTPAHTYMSLFRMILE
ncbi:DNA repair protein REV1 isoform X2 [Sesamum indicum]|uniref:DNA repair protein REV1 isoform X2 n=1 Tax=Sesamum indicum TaxID=4182 RepID=A0A8M8VA56_SESIN|nr:DNA repair protein REV1 isoform X2 [Sesamum indicum]